MRLPFRETPGEPPFRSLGKQRFRDKLEPRWELPGLTCLGFGSLMTVAMQDFLVVWRTHWRMRWYWHVRDHSMEEIDEKEKKRILVTETKRC